MPQAIAHVAAAIANAVGPGVVVEALVAELDIASPQPDALPVDARKIGLAADARREAAVERVIPDVHLPGIRRVDGRDEIAHAVHGVDDELVGADAVEA